MEGVGKSRRQNRRTECVEEDPSFHVKHKTVVMGPLLVATMSIIM